MVDSWGARHFGGYAGVKHTAKHIVAQVPNMSKYNTWVEPFSGLGRTAEYVRQNLTLILNDKSEYANNYCKEHFPNAIVENMDFIISIDTSLIHLASSMNKKAFLLLSKSSDWRWSHEKLNSPKWYDNLTIFRQKTKDNWEDVILEINKRLI